MMRKREYGYDDRPGMNGSYGKRGRGHNRDQSPMRYGNERSGYLANPDSVNARLYVGNLSPEITKEILEDHFSKWGEIQGVTTTKHGFGFVQFMRESDAQACLTTVQPIIIHGFRIDVKPARMSMSQATNVSAHGRGLDEGWSTDSILNTLENSRSQRDLDRRSGFFDSAYSESRDALSADTFDRPRRGDYGGRPERSGRDRYWETFESSLYGGGRSSLFRESTFDSTYGSSSETNASNDNKPNDVEIVVPNKSQRDYAESIETRLKQFDLTIDLLFPPSEISSERVIRDLSSRKCLYVIFTTAENEKHRSLTLNILHGDPQEHRNMPFDDAMRLIQQNFEEYGKKTRPRSMRDVVPRDIRNLLLDLLEMHPMSMGDLDKMIKYLRERQNALVDDQIEQKRETVGQAASHAVVTRSMTVTYPGYNVIATAGIPSVTPTLAHPATPASIVTASGVSMTYAGLGVQAPITGVLNAYGVQQPQLISNPLITQQFAAPHGAAPILSTAIDPNPKQDELQTRILNILNTQEATGPVPAPSVVQSPMNSIPRGNILTHQQHANLWSAEVQSNMMNQSQNTSNAYSPWT